MNEYNTGMSALVESVEDFTDKLSSKQLDLRMVMALAGERDLNAREELIIDKLRDERGESLFSDMLYALTHKTFPSRQARIIWGEIDGHRKQLFTTLGRDPGFMVATHDYLTNHSGLLRNVSLIEESKLTSLADVATHDGLTGLLDKRTFNRRLEEEIARQSRYGGRLAMVIVDIDNFKKLNDTFGHADGDIIIQQVADLMKEEARTTDVAARYGGEEFVVLLIGVGLQAGTTFAERLRANIEDRFKNTPYKTTISAGVAVSVKGDMVQSADEFIRKSDEQLYKAKHAGRNQVCMAGEIEVKKSA